MTKDLCIHDLQPATSSICRQPTVPKASQATLNFASIEHAILDLSDKGEFRTKDVANHDAVQLAHQSVRDDPRFDQQIGAYLTDAVGRLRIRQVSPKGRSNARWKSIDP
jgi:hypothetical protein